jgi:Uma2 family endonuclease
MGTLQEIAAMTLAERSFKEPERLWTREDWDRLVEMGFFDGERLELIEGRIVRMSPQRAAHSVAVELVDRSLRRALGAGFRIRCQMPFRSADGSEPEPDFAVIVGDDPRTSTEHPSSAVLIVEISDTTLEHDRRKAGLYAASGVPEYWILNLVARNLEVYRNPDTGRGGAARYASSQILSDRDRLLPLSSSVEVAVADLLP